jgi:hypothetical protein
MLFLRKPNGTASSFVFKQKRMKPDSHLPFSIVPKHIFSKVKNLDLPAGHNKHSENDKFDSEYLPCPRLIFRAMQAAKRREKQRQTLISNETFDFTRNVNNS